MFVILNVYQYPRSPCRSEEAKIQKEERDNPGWIPDVCPTIQLGLDIDKCFGIMFRLGSDSTYFQ